MFLDNRKSEHVPVNHKTSLGNVYLRVESAEKDIKVLLAVVVVQTLKDTELVTSGGRGGVGNTILVCCNSVSN